MQLSRTFLQLVDPPLDLGEVFLRMGLQDAKRSHKTRDFDFFLKFVITSTEESLSDVLTQAWAPRATTLGYDTLNIDG